VAIDWNKEGDVCAARAVVEGKKYIGSWFAANPEMEAIYTESQVATRDSFCWDSVDG